MAMAGPEPLTEHAHTVPVPGWLVALCRWCAAVGGLALMAIMLMTVASIARRSLLGAPIPGDFELVEIGSAIVVACFLPWGQITGSNVLVDFFTMKAGARTNHALEALGDLIYLVIGILLTWRMVHGAMDFHASGEQSMVLRVPLWLGFTVILPAMALLIVTTFFTLIGHWREVKR